jgi:hypothetical protein
MCDLQSGKSRCEENSLNIHPSSPLATYRSNSKVDVINTRLPPNSGGNDSLIEKKFVPIGTPLKGSTTLNRTREVPLFAL